MVNLSLEHGNSDGSCFAYVWLGMILGPHFGDYRAGFRFGKLGFDLVEQRGLDRFKARVYMSFGNLVIPWTRHVQTGRDLVRRAFDTANRIGDLTFAAYSCNNLITNLLASRRSAGRRAAAKPSPGSHSRARRASVSSSTSSPASSADPDAARARRRNSAPSTMTQFDEERFEHHFAERSASGAARVLVLDPQAAGALSTRATTRRAIDAASKAQRLLWTSPSFFEVAEYHFYGALARAAHCDAARADERHRHLEALAAHHEQLEVWAQNCPENFANRAALVGAEIARLEGRDLDADAPLRAGDPVGPRARLRPERGARPRGRRAVLPGARLRDDRRGVPAQRAELLRALGRGRQGEAARCDRYPHLQRGTGAASSDAPRSARRSNSWTSRPSSRPRRRSRARSFSPG